MLSKLLCGPAESIRMNFSQKHFFLLFTFLKCNVVYLCSWTAQIKAFIPECKQEREGGRQEGGGEEKSSKRARSSLRVTLSVPFHSLREYITGN